MYLILGNAIDNAVENYDCQKSLEKKIIIKIAEDNNNIFIKISNPYENELFFKNGLPTTTKVEKLNH